MATKKVGKKSGGKKSAAKKGGTRKVGSTKRKAVKRKTPGSLIGATVRWSFSEGPSKGTTYEHTFNADGSVEYRDVTSGKGNGKTTREKLCGVEKITPGVHVVSYLSSSGYTLTVVLNFEDMSAHSYASNEKGWFPAKGTFDVVKKS